MRNMAPSPQVGRNISYHKTHRVKRGLSEQDRAAA